MKDGNLAIKIIPVPRIISSSCGLAARTLVEDIEKVQKTIADEAIEIDEIYVMTDNNDIRKI